MVTCRAAKHALNKHPSLLFLSFFPSYKTRALSLSHKHGRAHGEGRMKYETRGRQRGRKQMMTLGAVTVTLMADISKCEIWIDSTAKRHILSLRQEQRPLRLKWFETVEVLERNRKGREELSFGRSKWKSVIADGGWSERRQREVAVAGKQCISRCLIARAPASRSTHFWPAPLTLNRWRGSQRGRISSKWTRERETERWKGEREI